MLRRDPLRDTLRSGSEARLSLPFLPTLVTALVIGVASLICREPAVAPALPPAAVGPQAFAPAAVAAEPAPRAPAALIFAEHYPLVPGAAPRPVPRLAAAASRRQALRAAEPPRRPETLAARPAPAADPLAPARGERMSEVAEGDSLLPDLVLPFTATVTPAVRAAGETAAFLKARATSLGGSVSAVMAVMR